MRDHERRDISVRATAIFFAALLGGTVAVFLLVWGLFALLQAERGRAEPPPMMEAGRLPPGPPLEIQDVKALRAEQDRRLSTYGWVDPDRRIARIPIERAMDLLAERGLPCREK